MSASFESACVIQVDSIALCVNGPFLLAITVLVISIVLGTVCWWCGRNPKWRAKGEFWFLDLTTERMTSEVIGFFGVFLMFSIALQMWLGYTALQGIPRYPPLQSITTSPFGHTIVATSGQHFLKPIALMLSTGEGESPLKQTFMCLAEIDQNLTCPIGVTNHSKLTGYSGFAVFDSFMLTLPKNGCDSTWVTVSTRCYQASSTEEVSKTPDVASSSPSLAGPQFSVLLRNEEVSSNVTGMNVTEEPPSLLAFVAGESNVSVSVPVTVTLHCTRSCANKVVSAVVIDFCSAQSLTLDEIARSLAWNESVSEIVREFVAAVSANGGACAVVTLSSIINQLLALLAGDLGSILSQGWPALLSLFYNILATEGFAGLAPFLTSQPLSGQTTGRAAFKSFESFAPTTAPTPVDYSVEIRQTAQLVVDNWPLVKSLMGIRNISWRNIINTNITVVSSLLPSVLTSDPSFLHYFTTYVSSLSDPSLFWDSTLAAQTEGLSAITDEDGVARFNLSLSASQSGLKYMMFTVDDMSFAQNFESSPAFYVYNNIESIVIGSVIIGAQKIRRMTGFFQPDGFFDCGHMYGSGWCDTGDNDIVLDPSDKLEYYVGLVFNTIQHNDTVRLEPWGSVLRRTDWAQEDFDVIAAQEAGNCRCDIQMLPASSGGTLRPRVHINQWGIRGKGRFANNVSTWYSIPFGVSGGSAGIYDLRVICNGVKSNSIRVTLLSTLTPSSPFDKTAFWIFLILAMVACQPIFWANAALPISFDRSNQKLIARLRAGQSRALLGLLGMVGLGFVLAMLKGAPDSSFSVAGWIMYVPFNYNYFANQTRALAHVNPAEEFWGGPGLWNSILQEVSMTIVLILFLMFGWHFVKFGLASAKLQYQQMLARLQNSAQTPQTQSYQVRSFRGFLRYIIVLTFIKVLILGVSMPLLLLLGGSSEGWAVRGCTVDVQAVTASFLLPSAAALGFMFRSLRENVLYTKRPLAIKVGQWLFTDSLPLVALFQLETNATTCFGALVNAIINCVLAAALLMADQDDGSLYVRISPPIMVDGDGMESKAFLKVPHWLFTWTAALCSVSQMVSYEDEGASGLSLSFVLLIALQLRLGAVLSSLTPLENEQVVSLSSRAGGFIAKAAQLYGDHARRFLHGPKHMKIFVGGVVWVLLIATAFVPTLGWVLVIFCLLWVLPVLVALRTQVGRASAGWYRSLQASAFETACDVAFGFFTCDPKIICYVLVIVGGVVGLFFGLKLSIVALSAAVFLFWNSLGSEAFDNQSFEDEAPAPPSFVTTHRGSLLKPSMSARTGGLADDLAYKSLPEESGSFRHTLPWPETQLTMVQSASFQGSLEPSTLPTDNSSTVIANASNGGSSAVVTTVTTTTATTANSLSLKDPVWDTGFSSTASLPPLPFLKDRKNSHKDMLLPSSSSSSSSSSDINALAPKSMHPSSSNYFPRRSNTFSSASSLSFNPHFDMHSTHSIVHPPPVSVFDAQQARWVGEHPELRIARHRVYVKRLFGAPYEHISCHQSLANQCSCYRTFCACMSYMCRSCWCVKKCRKNKDNNNSSDGGNTHESKHLFISPPSSAPASALTTSLLSDQSISVDKSGLSADKMFDTSYSHPKRIPITKMLEFRSKSFGLSDYPLRLKLGVGLSLWIALLLSVCCLVQVQWLQYGYYSVWATQGRAEYKSANNFLAFDDHSETVLPVAFLSTSGILFRLAGFVLQRLSELPNINPSVYIFIAFWSLLGSAVVGFITVLIFSILLFQTYKRQLLKMRRGVYPFDRRRLADFRPTYASRFIGYQIVHSTCAWFSVFCIMVFIGIIILLLYYWPAFRDATLRLLYALAVQGFQVIIIVSAFRLGTDVLFTANRGRGENREKHQVVRLDNKFLRAWTYVDYYNIFIYLVTGTYIVIVRLLFMPLLLIARLARLDVSVFPRKTESWDTAYSSYIAMLVTDHTYNNPVCVVFVQILGQDLLQKVRQEEEAVREKWLQQMSDMDSNASTVAGENALRRAFRARLGGDAFRASSAYQEWKQARLRRVRARNRWHLFVLLHHNVALRAYRKHHMQSLDLSDPIERKHPTVYISN